MAHLQPTHYQHKTNQYAEQFTTELKNLLRQLKQIVTSAAQQVKSSVSDKLKNVGDIDLFMMGIDVVGSKYIIENFIINSVTSINSQEVNVWDFMREKNDAYFLQNLDVLFSNDKSASVKEKFRFFFPLVAQGIKDGIWRSLHNLVKIAIHYVHYKRVPSVSATNKKMYSYMSEFPKIDIVREIRGWSVMPSFTD